MDAFWVEATREEAVQWIIPRLTVEQRAESEEWASECPCLAQQISQPPRPYCYLVARDLSSIDPFVVHYPFHQSWNAYSPFRSISVRTIASLDELEGIPLEDPM